MGTLHRYSAHAYTNSFIVNASLESIFDRINDLVAKWDSVTSPRSTRRFLREWQMKTTLSLKDYLLKLSASTETVFHPFDKTALEKLRAFPKIQYNRLLFHLTWLDQTYGPSCEKDFNDPHNLVSVRFFPPLQILAAHSSIDLD